MGDYQIADDQNTLSLTRMTRLDNAVTFEAADINATTNDGKKDDKVKIFKQLHSVDAALRKVDIDGWTHFVEASSIIGRLFWLFILCLCLALLTYEVVAVFINFYTRPLSTSYRIVTNESMVFPNIYICPLSAINWTVIENNLDLIRYVSYMNQATGIQNYEGVLTEDAESAPSLNYTIFDVKEKFMQFGYSVQEFMLACSFSSMLAQYLQCSDIVEERLDPVYGKCFMLSLGSDTNRTQTVAGRGLTVTFNVHKELYADNQFFASSIEGVALLVGDEWLFLRPGSKYNIALKAERLVFINIDRGQVHHHCVGGGDNEYAFKVIIPEGGQYSQRECAFDCYAQEIWSICDCFPVRDPTMIRKDVLNAATHPLLCDRRQYILCISPLVDNNPAVITRVEQCRRQCYTPCDYIRHEMKASDVPLYAPAYPFLLEYYNTTIDNIIDVAISYSTLDYAEFRQDISKSYDELVSDLGGQIGLWLGVSMVTIVQLPLLFTTWCMCASYRRASVATEAVVKTARRFSGL